MDDKIKSIIAIGSVIGFIIVFTVVCMFTDMFGRIWSTEVDHMVFKSSTAYTEATASFIAESYQQYNEAESELEKQGIMDYVINKYPNIDTNNIENDTLRDFYNKCLIGE